MKFIHTSDWHIGRIFHNVSLLEDQSAILEQLIDYLVSYDVDALLIAGDIYDRAIPPAKAVELLDKVICAICGDLGIPIIIIPGNHDSSERLRFGSEQLKRGGLHILGNLQTITTPVQIIGKSSVKINFYGIPYNDPEEVRSIFDVKVSSYDEAHRFLVDKVKESMDEKEINVLLSHCFIDGAEESESERPLSIGGSDRVSFEPMVDFDYVALGHLHSPQYKGKEHIRYSGSLMKYSFSEVKQKKSVTLVEFNENSTMTFEKLPLESPHDLRIIEGQLEDIITQGRNDKNRDDYLLVRLTNREAILDVIGKIRAVYPNVMQLEKTMTNNVFSVPVDRSKIEKRENELFQDFFQEIYGEKMSDAQEEALQSVIKNIYKKDEL